MDGWLERYQLANQSGARFAEGGLDNDPDLSGEVISAGCPCCERSSYRTPPSYRRDTRITRSGFMASGLGRTSGNI